MVGSDGDIRFSFPGLRASEAGVMAAELERELVALGCRSDSFRRARTDHEAMDLGAALVLSGGALAFEFAGALVKGAGEGLGVKLGQDLYPLLRTRVVAFCKRHRVATELSFPGQVTRVLGSEFERDADESPEQVPSDVGALCVVTLGASAYDHLPDLNNPAFAQSAALARAAFARGNGVFARTTTLDLFDGFALQPEITEIIQDHIDGNADITDILIYYCGHGDFLTDGTYILTLRGTSAARRSTSSLKLKDLRHDLESRLVNRRFYLVLDCCYAGAGAKEFMGPGVGRVVETAVTSAMPRDGWIVLAAASSSLPAMAPEGYAGTMFTSALAHVLDDTLLPLSISRLIGAAKDHIRDVHRDKAVFPEYHTARHSRDGLDLARMPLFGGMAGVGAWGGDGIEGGALSPDASAPDRVDLGAAEPANTSRERLVDPETLPRLKAWEGFDKTGGVSIAAPAVTIEGLMGRLDWGGRGSGDNDIGGGHEPAGGPERDSEAAEVVAAVPKAKSEAREDDTTTLRDGPLQSPREAGGFVPKGAMLGYGDRHAAKKRKRRVGQFIGLAALAVLVIVVVRHDGWLTALTKAETFTVALQQTRLLTSAAIDWVTSRRNQPDSTVPPTRPGGPAALGAATDTVGPPLVLSPPQKLAPPATTAKPNPPPAQLKTSAVEQPRDAYLQQRITSLANALGLFSRRNPANIDAVSAARGAIYTEDLSRLDDNAKKLIQEADAAISAVQQSRYTLYKAKSSYDTFKDSKREQIDAIKFVDAVHDISDDDFALDQQTGGNVRRFIKDVMSQFYVVFSTPTTQNQRVLNFLVQYKVYTIKKSPEGLAALKDAYDSITASDLILLDASDLKAYAGTPALIKN